MSYCAIWILVENSPRKCGDKKYYRACEFLTILNECLIVNFSSIQGLVGITL